MVPSRLFLALVVVVIVVCSLGLLQLSTVYQPQPSPSCQINLSEVVGNLSAQLQKNEEPAGGVVAEGVVAGAGGSPMVDIEAVDSSFCLYPDFPAAFDFDHARYSKIYPNEDVIQCKHQRPPNPFTAQVDAEGWLTVTGCLGQSSYATTSDEDPTPFEGRVQLDSDRFPLLTFVYVHCENFSEPILLPVHRPIAKQKRRPPPKTARKSIIIIETDALSKERLPIQMPQTHAFMESLRGGFDGRVAFQFPKFGISGGNSVPNLLALGGHTRDPSYKKPALWKVAHENGYITTMGETSGSPGNLANFGFNTTSAQGSEDVDHFLVPMYRCERYYPHRMYIDSYKPRCLLGKPVWTYGASYITQMLENYADGENPIFLYFDFIEPHEPSGCNARHLDDSGFASFLRSVVRSALMDDGILLLMSDHGLHYGNDVFGSLIGAQEHMNPYLYVVMPTDHISSSQERTIQLNTQQLVTPFDLYFGLMTEITGEGRQHRRPSPRTFSPFHEAIPSFRGCEQTEMPVERGAVFSTYCLCESPSTKYCSTKPEGVHGLLWLQCTQLYSHPLVFNASFYNQQHGPFGSRCEALYHWCVTGLRKGYTAHPDFDVMAYRQLNPNVLSNGGDLMGYIRHYSSVGFFEGRPATDLAVQSLKELEAVCSSANPEHESWWESLHNFKTCPTKNGRALKSPFSFERLVQSAKRQCFQWCVFDVQEQQGYRGWHLESDCWYEFSSKIEADPNHTCVRDWAHLKPTNQSAADAPLPPSSLRSPPSTPPSPPTPTSQKTKT